MTNAMFHHDPYPDEPPEEEIYTDDDDLCACIERLAQLELDNCHYCLTEEAFQYFKEETRP